MSNQVVLFDVRMLCERWGATEAEVRAIAESELDALDCLHPEHVLAGGLPLFDECSVEEAERLLPELARRDVKGALEALRAAQTAADAEFPALRPGWHHDAHEWEWKLWEERHAYIYRLLEGRMVRAA